MTFVERLADLKKRFDRVAEMKDLSVDNAQAILVRIIRDCRADGAEAERKACREIVKTVSDRDFQDDCSRIGEALRIAVARIEARGVEPIVWESNPDANKIGFHFIGSEKI